MKCETCGTSNGYYRLETKEWVCRKCGTIKQVEDNDAEKED